MACMIQVGIWLVRFAGNGYTNSHICDLRPLRNFDGCARAYSTHVHLSTSRNRTKYAKTRQAKFSLRMRTLMEEGALNRSHARRDYVHFILKIYTFH